MIEFIFEEQEEKKLVKDLPVGAWFNLGDNDTSYVRKVGDELYIVHQDMMKVFYVSEKEMFNSSMNVYYKHLGNDTLPNPNFEEKELTFGDVEVDHFFVDNEGCLLQKKGDCYANQIADKNGDLNSLSDISYGSQEKIKKILPKVKKIKF